MSFNGSGTFVINSTGQPVVTGTVISSSTFNSLTADLGTGLSTAITKDGQTTTTAKIPFALGISAAVASNFAAGTVAAPSIYLSTDTGTGLYRIGANNNGYSVSGTKLLDLGSALVGVTGALTVSTTLAVTGTTTAAAINASGLVAMAGAATVGTTLGVTGNTTIGSNGATPGGFGKFLSVRGSANGAVVVGRDAASTDALEIGWTTASASLTTYTNVPININVNNSVIGAFSSTGLSVTGTLGATGITTISASAPGDYALKAINSTGSNPYGISLTYSGAAPNDGTHSFVECFDTGATRAQIRSNGGLANFSANNVNLSDARTKKNIQLAGNYLDKICAIPVKTFLYKDQTDDALNLGVIAQDVEAVAPELVDVSGFGVTPEDGVPFKAIYQTDLQYALMKAIQEISADFEAYKAAHP